MGRVLTSSQVRQEWAGLPVTIPTQAGLSTKGGGLLDTEPSPQLETLDHRASGKQPPGECSVLALCIPMPVCVLGEPFQNGQPIRGHLVATTLYLPSQIQCRIFSTTLLSVQYL